jgi:hypothetical protein
MFVHKLDSRYDFHTSAMGMVSSFLRDRSMVVEVDGVKSTPRSLSSGVLQRCIPSPLFFSMFINDFCSCIYFSKFHLYADDLQIYLYGNKKDFDEMIFVLNENLLNPRKLQVIPSLNIAVGMVLSSMFLCTVEIPWCDAVTELGVVIDGRLYATLHILRLLKFLTPKRVRL